MFLIRIHLFIALLIIIVINNISAEQYKIVGTLNGQVRGVQTATLWKNILFYAFKGIPYAKPPVGDLRLKAPQPVESWAPTILDALKHGDTCIQQMNPLPQSENCLTLNIYVPADIKPNEKLAVLFFIHGGGYGAGASNDVFYGPDFIIEKETILVTINYRLGLLGFLSLDTPEYSGNMGLKDQQLALKWIHSNIGRFGGDDERITVFGESAGGISTHFHILSSESRKYFRNAISMSGVVDNYCSMTENRDQLEFAHQIARDLDEPKSTHEELLEFFKSAPIAKILEVSVAFKNSPLLQTSFIPTIERKNAKQPFLTESPEKMYETSNINVDVLFTMTSMEYIFFLPLAPTLEELEKNHFNFPLPFRGSIIQSGSEKYQNLTSQIRKFYFNDTTIGDQAFQQYVAMLSDMNFGYRINKAVQKHAALSNAKAYYYRFSVDSKLNIFKRKIPRAANISGVSHADDLFYVFRFQAAETVYNEIKSNINDQESKICLQTIDYVTKIITNFAKYGEPSHQGDPIDGFEPAQRSQLNFLDITNDGLTVGRDPNGEAFKFWANIESMSYL